MSHRIGSKNGNAKLNETDVEVIRWRMENKRHRINRINEQIETLQREKVEVMKSDSIPQMALDFEVSESAIKNVLYRSDIWGHVK